MTRRMGWLLVAFIALVAVYAAVSVRFLRDDWSEWERCLRRKQAL